MDKKIISLILGILFLNLVSAQISLSPSTFNIDAMPGETHFRNITITTDGNYAVYLNSSSEGNITINYSSPLIVEKSKIIEVAFFFPKDLAPGIYDIQINGSTEVYKETITTSSGSSGGSGGGMSYVLPNGTIVYKKPTNFSTAPPIQIVEKIYEGIVKNNLFNYFFSSVE